MKLGLDGNILLAIDLNDKQYKEVSSWGLMTWDKKKHWLAGYASLDLLDRMAGLGRLPERIEDRRRQLHAVQAAVDAERLTETPVLFAEPPVKAALFSHQKRAVNMALLVFGWASADGSVTQSRTSQEVPS